MRKTKIICTIGPACMNEETLVRLHDADEYPAWIACAKLIRRDLIEDYPFREGRVYEDNEAVCRWVCKGGSLARTGEALYFYAPALSDGLWINANRTYLKTIGCHRFYL